MTRPAPTASSASTTAASPAPASAIRGLLALWLGNVHLDVAAGHVGVVHGRNASLGLFVGRECEEGEAPAGVVEVSHLAVLLNLSLEHIKSEQPFFKHLAATYVTGFSETFSLAEKFLEFRTKNP